jgi:hypothetical protein
LKKAVNELGPLGSKILQENQTGIRLHEKALHHPCLGIFKTFVLPSSSKASQPAEPTKGKAWTEALMVSQEIMNSISQTVQTKTFCKLSASETTCQADHSIAQVLWLRTNQDGCQPKNVNQDNL